MRHKEELGKRPIGQARNMLKCSIFSDSVQMRWYYQLAHGYGSGSVCHLKDEINLKMQMNLNEN